MNKELSVIEAHSSRIQCILKDTEEQANNYEFMCNILLESSKKDSKKVLAELTVLVEKVIRYYLANYTTFCFLTGLYSCSHETSEHGWSFDVDVHRRPNWRTDWKSRTVATWCCGGSSKILRQSRPKNNNINTIIGLLRCYRNVDCKFARTGCSNKEWSKKSDLDAPRNVRKRRLLNKLAADLCLGSHCAIYFALI